MGKRFYQGMITLWCLLIGVNIYSGISSYFHGNWSGVLISAAMIGWLWKLIWREYDESRDSEED